MRIATGGVWEAIQGENSQGENSMKLPLEIVAKDTVLSPLRREQLKAQAGKLDHFYGRIMRCRVTVQGPRGHTTGGRWVVRLDLTVPRSEITVSRQYGETFAEAVREAFAAAGRRVEDYARRRREPARLPSRPKGAFRRNGVMVGGLEALMPGAPARYVEEEQDMGSPAASVAPAGDPGGADREAADL
jgi:hypothetical protein